MHLTFIITQDGDGKAMMRPACELYRTLEQATRNVLRREYERGIATWLRSATVHRNSRAATEVQPLGVTF